MAAFVAPGTASYQAEVARSVVIADDVMIRDRGHMDAVATARLLEGKLGF
jgi:hypothetical protein